MKYFVIIQCLNKRLYHHVIADDHFYDSLKQNMNEFGIEFIYGKKGISKRKIDNIRKNVQNLVARLNHKKEVNLKKELETIF